MSVDCANDEDLPVHVLIVHFIRVVSVNGARGAIDRLVIGECVAELGVFRNLHDRATVESRIDRHTIAHRRVRAISGEIGHLVQFFGIGMFLNAIVDVVRIRVFEAKENIVTVFRVQLLNFSLCSRLNMIIFRFIGDSEHLVQGRFEAGKISQVSDS